MSEKILSSTNITYQWLSTASALENALHNGLKSLYKTCFSQPPYNEFYTDTDVATVFDRYSQKDGMILAACNQQDTVVGFSVKTPLNQMQRMMISENGLSYCYGADLGVDPGYRRNGISTMLECLQKQKMSETYHKELTRTSASSFDRIANNLKLGKRRMNYTENVEMTRTDGSIRADQRIYFEYDLRIPNTVPDQYLERVLLWNESDGNGTAFVYDAVKNSSQADLSALVQGNYPGVKKVLFAMNEDQATQQNKYDEAFYGVTPDKLPAVVLPAVCP